MPDPTRFELTLVDPNEAVSEAFADAFAEEPAVSVRRGRFEQLDRYDCMVSAANSFGLMDGGVDGAITRFFGYELMDRVQQRIVAEWRGEQPVGTSMIVETGHPDHPWLAHTPTMRVPMAIAGTDNVYLAMWAMLLAVWKHNLSDRSRIEIVACPGLGTATGRVPPARAARQMRLAWQHFHDPPSAMSWPLASVRQGSIGAGGDEGFRRA